MLLVSPQVAGAGPRAVVEVDRVETAVAVAEGLRVEVTWPGQEGPGALSLRAERVSAEGLGYVWQGLTWRCGLERRAGGRIDCSGPVAAVAGPVLSDAAGRQLTLTIAHGGVAGTLAGDDARLRVLTRVDRPDSLAVVAVQVPVAWLQAFVATLWADGQLSAGLLDGELHIDTGDADRIAAKGDFSLDGLGFDTPDGLLAAGDVGADVQMTLALVPGAPQVSLQGRLRGGELLAGSIYVPLPDDGVDFAVEARQDDGRWSLPSIRWSDGNALQVEGALALDETLSIASGRLAALSGDAGTLGERYLTGLLAPAGLSQLRLAGQLAADADWAAGGFDAASMRLEGVNAIDGAGRFSFAGLRGHPRWTAGDDLQTSSLSWSAGALYGLGLGPAELTLHSRDGEIGLGSPVEMALLGGRLGFDHFTVRTPDADSGARIELGLSLSRLDLGDLSQRLGWPAFTGTIEGNIPSAVYANDTLTLDGGLQMSLFDGELDIGALSMERPFGVAPTLSADIDLRGIRMQPLTAAFGFGEITGELAGRIHGLRLVDWSAVAFDARLYSDPSFRGRQRVSQRAVRDISSVGGNFLVSELQNQALRLFSSFGYRQMGIACRLVDEVCFMEGIGSRGEGYTIVEGSGLPRLTVVGFRRQVDWPLLVERLQAVGDGQMPVFD